MILKCARRERSEIMRRSGQLHRGTHSALVTGTHTHTHSCGLRRLRGDTFQLADVYASTNDGAHLYDLYDSHTAHAIILRPRTTLTANVTNLLKHR